jgi:AraC-like DNA-binding protein
MLPVQIGLHPETAPEILYAGLMNLQHWNWSNLSASHWRWYWNDQPGAYITLDRQRWNLLPEEIMLVPPRLPCSAGTIRVVQHFFIHFTLPWDYQPAHPRPLTRLISPQEKQLIHQFRTSQHHPTPERYWTMSRLAHLLIQLAIPLIPVGDLRKPESDPRIEKAVAICRRALSHSASNTELARMTGISPRTLIRLFAQITGETPHQYQLQRRLEQACRLMHNPELTIEEIAERTGFYDRFHFSRVFRQQMKITPAVFRRHLTWNNPRLKEGG